MQDTANRYTFHISFSYNRIVTRNHKYYNLIGEGNNEYYSEME